MSLQQEHIPFILASFGLLAVFAVFLLIIIACIYSLRKSRESESWPSVSGIIVDSFIKESRDCDNYLKYAPEVSYSYSLQSIQYKNNLISYGGRMTIRSIREAEAYIAPFYKGNNVLVFYNPKNPQDSCLIKSDGKLILNFLLYASAAMIILATIILRFLSKYLY